MFVPVFISTGIADLAFVAGILAGGFPSVIFFFVWSSIHRKAWEEISKKETTIIKQARDKTKYNRKTIKNNIFKTRNLYTYNNFRFKRKC